MPEKVCISGYYGFDNFGDETILKILAYNLQEFDLTVFSSNPNKTSNLYKVKSVYTFDIFNVLKSLMRCDCLISGGGSLLQDTTSIKSLIYYLFIITFTAVLRKKIIIFAQGIGPIRNKFLSAFTFFILKKSSYICVRDIKSLELADKHGLNSELCNDPVWNLPLYNKKTNNILGIQLRNFYSLTDEFLKSLAECINFNCSNKTIHILSLQNSLDLDICNKFKGFLLDINSGLKVNVIENTSNEKVIQDLCNSDEIIAMRYHACLIAIKNKIKLLPLSYDIKVEMLAKQFNLQYIDLNSKQNLSEIIQNFNKNQITYDENQINNLKYDFDKLKDIIIME